MKRALLVTVAFVAAINLGGCVTTGGSKALQIARAAGIADGGLRDLPPDAKIEFGDGGVGVMDGVIATGQALHLGGTSIGGLTGGSAAAATLFAAMLQGSPEASKPWVLAWIPVSEAPDAKAAQQQLADAILTARKAARPEGYRVLKSSDWEEKGIDAQGREWSLYYGRPEKPRQRQAPEALGGYEAYTWVRADLPLPRVPARYSAWVTRGGEVDGPALFHHYREFSRALPAWAYVYMPPFKGVISVPLIFNQGEIYQFIKPEEQG